MNNFIYIDTGLNAAGWMFTWPSSTNTVLDGSVTLSVCDFVCLSVCYRNHFPVVRFQNQACTYLESPWNGSRFKNHLGRRRRPKFVFIIFFFFIAAEGGVSCRPDRGAPGAPNRGPPWPPTLFFFFFYFFHRRRRRWFPKWAPGAPQIWGASLRRLRQR